MEGSISVKDVRPALLALGQTPTDKELKNIIDLIDNQGTGRIDFQDFLTILALKIKHPDTEEHLRLAFKIFDKDGNGNVSAAELKDAMATLGEDISQEDIDQMIMLADVDGDGQVNYEGQYNAKSTKSELLKKILENIDGCSNCDGCA